MRVLLLLIIVLGSFCPILNAQADNQRNLEVLRNLREHRGRGMGNSLFQFNGVEVLDLGIDAQTQTSIDVQQNVCEEAEDDGSRPAILEKFEDTLLKIKIKNLLTRSVRMKKFWFRMAYPEGQISAARSQIINFTSNQLLEPQSESEQLAIMLEANNGLKIFPGHGPLSQEGFRNVKFFLRARAKDGSRIFRKLKTTLSFRNEDRCQ